MKIRLARKVRKKIWTSYPLLTEIRADARWGKWLRHSVAGRRYREQGIDKMISDLKASRETHE